MGCMGYTLYGRAGSGSLAVQVALEEIGAAHELIWVGRAPGEIESYRKLNPTGKVPALVLPDGTLMFESAAMLIYLAQAHPKSGLAPPPGTAAFALFLQWMVFLSANLYESVLRIYYSSRYSIRGEADAPAVREQGIADFKAHLKIVSRALKPYLLGVEYSIADVYLHMLVDWHVGEKSELFAELASLGAHDKLIRARPFVAKVEAEHAQ
jgi:glutathione S-transferase